MTDIQRRAGLFRMSFNTLSRILQLPPGTFIESVYTDPKYEDMLTIKFRHNDLPITREGAQIPIFSCGKVWMTMDNTEALTQVVKRREAEQERP